jgi:hypothetical protein
VSNDYGNDDKLNLIGEPIKSKVPITIRGENECNSNLIQFCKDAKVVGTLDFGKEPITFVGDTDVSAQILFETIIQLVAGEVGRLRDERDDASKLLVTIAKMCPVNTADEVPEYIEGLWKVIENLKLYTNHKDTCASVNYNGKHMGGAPGKCNCGLNFILGFAHVR